MPGLATQFKKGMKPWNKGLQGYNTQPASKERKIKIGLANSGRIRTAEAKQKNRLAHLGKKHSIETRRKMSLKHKGKKYCLGIKQSIDARKKRSASMMGSKNPLWKGGITPINRAIRMSLEYKLWRESVFKRDNWTCVWCKSRNGNGKTIILHADHIKPFAYFPELRFAIDNGRTLCVLCHKLTSTYGAKKYNCYH